jgi:hypothetical protein
MEQLVGKASEQKGSFLLETSLSYDNPLIFFSGNFSEEVSGNTLFGCLDTLPMKRLPIRPSPRRPRAIVLMPLLFASEA